MLQAPPAALNQPIVTPSIREVPPAHFSKLPALCYNNDTHSFGFMTCRSRWPKIITDCINDTKDEMDVSLDNKLKLDQGELIMKQLSDLIDHIVENGEIQKFHNNDIPGLNSFDETLTKLEKENGGRLTWLTGPWLFTECYLYRCVDSIFKPNSEWIEFDCFERLKRETFISSAMGVYELVIRYHDLSVKKAEIESKTKTPLKHHQFLKLSGIDHDHDHPSKKSEIENLKLLREYFEEFMEVSLWGNATDLSLLANATLDEIKAVQGKDARVKSRKNILTNDLDEAWDRIISAKGKRRVDFILDNAGFEFFTDLCLSLFLLDFGLADKVVYHCKTRSWMVSDTMMKDVQILLDDMLDEKSFPEYRDQIKFFVKAIQRYQENGQIELAESEFWTVDLDHWNICKEETKYGGAELWKYFQDSTLVIFKGDLNYRKLTGDRHWPRHTPFTTAINKLASSGIHLLALRTCKADVCAGLTPGKDQELCKYWESLGHEIGELWCSSGKWAVISYSDGQN